MSVVVVAVLVGVVGVVAVLLVVVEGGVPSWGFVGGGGMPSWKGERGRRKHPARGRFENRQNDLRHSRLANTSREFGTKHLGV
eukprot:COSAG04_NODE_25555_length_306_cov_0.661836_1_plen_82_part_10